MATKMRETETASIAVSVNDGPFNQGVIFEVPETHQQIISVDNAGMLTALRPGAAVVNTRQSSDQAVLSQPIFVVRRSAQAIYEDEVRLGLRRPRTVFTPL